MATTTSSKNSTMFQKIKCKVKNNLLIFIFLIVLVLGYCPSVQAQLNEESLFYMSDNGSGSSDNTTDITTDSTTEVTTSGPIEVATNETIEVTTSDPIEVTTSDPIEVTTSDPIEVTTSDPIEVTTSDPIEVTTSGTTDPEITSSTTGPTDSGPTWGTGETSSEDSGTSASVTPDGVTGVTETTDNSTESQGGGASSGTGDDLDSGETALIVISSMAVGGCLLSLVGYAIYKHIQWSGAAPGKYGASVRYQNDDVSYQNQAFDTRQTPENFGYDQESDSYQNQPFGVLEVNTSND